MLDDRHILGGERLPGVYPAQSLLSNTPNSSPWMYPPTEAPKRARFDHPASEADCSATNKQHISKFKPWELWELTVLEQWAAALHTPSMQRAHMECSGPHALGIEFIRNVIKGSIRVWYAYAKAHATLLKAGLGPGSTMARVLQELRLHTAGTSEMTAVARG